MSHSRASFGKMFPKQKEADYCIVFLRDIWIYRRTISHWEQLKLFCYINVTCKLLYPESMFLTSKGKDLQCMQETYNFIIGFDGLHIIMYTNQSTKRLSIFSLFFGKPTFPYFTVSQCTKEKDYRIPKML